MIKQMELQGISARRLQLGCLTAMGAVEAAVMLLGTSLPLSVALFLTMVLNMTGALMLGTMLLKKQKRPFLLLLGLGFCLWAVVLQIYDFRYAFLQEFYTPRFAASTFLVEYGVLLPYASMGEEGERPEGLNRLGSWYLAASAVLVVMTLLQCADRIPGFAEALFCWQGTRLSLMWHPNVLASVFLLGIGFCLIRLTASDRRWVKILLGLLAAAMFLCSCLTNSRAANSMICCLFGGLVFFLIYGGGGWKRLLAGLLAAVVVIGLLFMLSSLIYGTHVEAFLARSEEAREELRRSSGQKSLAENFSSFNGRTEIWKASFRALGHHPQTLIVGTPSPAEFLNPYNSFRASHAHNSWIQTLLGMGLVGFLIAAVLTVMVVKSCLMLFFVRKVPLYQKMTAVLTTAIMGAEFFETYLFYVEFPGNFVSAAFMLCAGYVITWDARAEKRQG